MYPTAEAEGRLRVSVAHDNMNTTRSGFGRRLTSLFAAAGAPPAKSVVRAANSIQESGRSPITEQRISDWRRGIRVPAKFVSIQPVLEVLITYARQRAVDGAPIDRSLFDMDRWRRDWTDARSDSPARTQYPAVSPQRIAAHRKLDELIELAGPDAGELVITVGLAPPRHHTVGANRIRRDLLIEPEDDPVPPEAMIARLVEARLLVQDNGAVSALRETAVHQTLPGEGDGR